MIAKKAKPLPIECVVRGYIAGSGWKEYRESGTVGGHLLPAGLKQRQ
jgi:phosphoribosylaminoimidazole-succinocarboxamide synthase